MSRDADALRSVFEVIRRHSQVTPGRYAALALAGADGPIAARAFLDGDEVEPEPRSSIASLTKPVTATAVMRLVEEGRIDLDEPVADRVSEFRPSRGPGMSEPARVTIRHVLSHTSGLSDIADAKLAKLRPTPEAMLEAVSRKRVRFPPGSAYAYASDPWYLLSALIERVTGVRFPAYVREHITRPLGMTTTGFDPTSLDGSVLPPHGSLAMTMWPEQPLDVFASLEIPGGGLWSTPDDLLRFGRAMLRGGELEGVRIIGASAVDTMTADQTAGVRQYGTGEAVHYGLGWDRPGLCTIGPLPPSSFTHTGATGSILAVDPANDLVLVYLRNQWGAPMDLTGQAVSAVYAALAA